MKKKNILLTLIGGVMLSFRKSSIPTESLQKSQKDLSSKKIHNLSKNLNVADTISHIIKNDGMKEKMLNVLKKSQSKAGLKTKIKEHGNELSFGKEFQSYVSPQGELNKTSIPKPSLVNNKLN